MRTPAIVVMVILSTVPAVARYVSPETRQLQQQWTDLNPACSSLMGKKKAHDEACKKQAALVVQLKSLNRCYISDYESWSSCDQATAHESAKAYERQIAAEQQQEEARRQELRAADPNYRLGDYDATGYKTKEGGLICDFPGKMNEGAQAISDPAWLKQIGCLTTRTGLTVTRINDQALVPHGEWRVHITASDSEGGDFFTWSCELAFPDGTPVRVCY